MRTRNHLIGLANFLTFLLSIVILGGGIWLATRANSINYLCFLQWLFIIIGAFIAVVSLAGFAGACYCNTLLMYIYMWAMFFILAALIRFVIFAYVFTDKGSGRPMYNCAYEFYYLQDYAGCLKDRVSDPGYWANIRACLRDFGVCAMLRKRGLREDNEIVNEVVSIDCEYEK